MSSIAICRRPQIVNSGIFCRQAPHFARGLGLLHTLAAETPIERALSALLRTDAQTQRPVLTVPLPESFATERPAGVVSGLLNKLAGVP